jgi:ABC transporter substrate binding protein
MNSNRERIVALATRHKLPTILAWREAVMAGGVMSYGTSQSDAYRHAGMYAGRILKGEKPGDLPVGVEISALVVGIPCGKPLSVLSVPFFRSPREERCGIGIRHGLVVVNFGPSVLASTGLVLIKTLT